MHTLPKRLQSEKAQREWQQAHAGERDPVGAALVRLGPVLPRAGETIAVELWLPAEWER